MKLILVFLAGLVAFSCAACPPSPPPPPPKPGPNVVADGGSALDAAPDSAPLDAGSDTNTVVIVVIEDAGTGEPCDRACARLKLLGCPEGTPSDGGQSCVAVCQHAETSRLTNLKPECLAGARTVQEAQACKTVRCAQLDAGAKKKP